MADMSLDACDILIRGGTVFDGLGSPPARAEVAVTAGIANVLPPGSLPRAGQVIEAAGCFVAPGFIDIHSHSDFSSLAGPAAASRVAAGITAECNGNCGYGAFPLAGEVLRRRQADCEPYKLALSWKDARGYFEAARSAGSAIHRATLIGHGNVRGCVVGYGNVRATQSQLDEMCHIVDECMAAGCAGLSTGMAYAPGMWADTDELSALATVVARHGGIYASHIRSEGDGLIESVQEFLEVLRRSRCRGQLSHVKTGERRNWHKIAELKELLAAAREEGLDFHADRYPYTASATDLATIVLPSAAREGTLDELLERLTSPAQRAKVIEAIRRQKGSDLEKWCENVLVSAVVRRDLQNCVGKNLRQIADIFALKDPVEAAIRLICEDRTDTQAIHFSMSPDNLREIYSWDFVAVGSDSSSRDFFEGGSGDDGRDRPHPRAYGTPGRFIELVVRQWKLMDWPEAIRRVTSLPAKAIGLKDRGVLRTGGPADIVVFNPETFAGPATYESPCRPVTGVVTTLVDGQIVWQNGRHTGALPGKLLR